VNDTTTGVPPVVDPPGALALLDELATADPDRAEAIFDTTVALPDGAHHALGDLTGTQVRAPAPALSQIGILP
jgi:hypothetical protein